MRILMIGGTRFVGRHIVQGALERGHSVTLFHRGQSGVQLFDGQVTRVLGDRIDDLQKLDGQKFDAVIDTCGYKPGEVRKAAEYFKDRASHYLFISTISVYDGSKEPIEGQPPVYEPLDRDDLPVDGETYGPLKVACEESLRSVWPAERTTILRPGLIVGPYDHTDRFTYWLARLDAFDEVVAPNDAATPIQVIDARDLADFALHCVTRKTAGCFNVVGPEDRLSFKAMVELAADVCHAERRVFWMDPALLLDRGAKPWADLPLYVGPKAEDWALMQLFADDAVSKGLLRRPLMQTMIRTIEWWREERQTRELSAGWSRDAEVQFLKDFRNQP